MDVFAVRTDSAGTPVGRRRHVCRRAAGEAFFPVPSGRIALLAVPSSGAEMVPVDRMVVDVAALVESWVTALGEGVFDGTPPKESVRPVPGEVLEVEAGAALRSRDQLVWVRFEEGGATLGGRPELSTNGRAVPVGARPWLVTTAPTVAHVASTAERLAEAGLDADLDAFHGLVLNALAADEDRGLAAEGARAARRAEGARAALAEGSSHLASILLPNADAVEAEAADALMTAAMRVGRALGVEIEAPPARDLAARRDRVGEIARASRLRVRKVVLSGDWWRADVGPVLGMAMPEGAGQAPRPVALLRRKGKTVLLDGADQTVVTEAVADRVHPVAFTFYRPFPDRALSALDVARFGLAGGSRDLGAILAVGLVVGLLGLLTPYVTGELFQTAIPEADRGLLFQLIGALVASALGTAAFHATRGLALLRLESRMDVTVQAAVWDRLLKLPTGFFRRFTAGELASRAGAISSIRQLLSGATITSLLSAVFSVTYVGLMLWYSVTLSLWAIGLTGIALTCTLVASWVQLRHQREVSEVQSRLQGRVLQFLTGLTKLRVAGAEAKAFSHWARDFGRQRALQVRAKRSANGLGTFNAAFPIVSSLVLFAVVASGDEGPLLPIGTFVAFHAAYASFTAAVLSLSGAFTSVLMAIPLYEQAEPILTALPEVDATKADPGELTGRLGVEHATFRYDPEGSPILQDVTIRAEPGEFVALVGPSGSGKSTVLRLLLGFETPEAGAVLYDDHDLAEIDVQAVRRQLGVVLQSGGLMQGDLFTNIVGSSGATHDDAWEAARMAGFDRDVQKMPMGMHTVVSEGGTTLSGGQRQRLMIARAIVGKPRLLFFDEATSALDNHTQATVSRSLEALEATRIVVAHRLSTIQNADRIYVIDRGRVVQEGTYDELLAVPGLFADLAARQLA
ncbi:NHLP bacteriocin export ABC transporter permease/ATPase subunit [Rubrivirga sp. SAORIC476]|nr:NHLP bacteriocin export ABC transporter permease/ATPase subunit [Rubrivirga sp. SAORIC476]